MKINRAYRYELDPNIAQRILLAKHAGCARFAFNWGLQIYIEQYTQDKTTTNAIELHRLLNRSKVNCFPWMYEVSKCAPQEALRDLEKAFKNFFRGCKQNKKIGFPKFKKKGRHDSFRLTGTIRVTERGIQLPRLGIIRTKEIPAIEGKIFSVTVSQEAGHWFASISVEVEIETPKPVQGPPVGIDLGLTTFATLSTGEKIESPKPLKKYLRKLRRASKQHSRKVKGSSNRKKSAKKIARLHYRIRNIRNNFHHELSTKLAKNKSIIVIENLNTQGMMRNRRLSRHIADSGWAQFCNLLKYKTEWYGSKLVTVPRFFASSKICSGCGCQVEKLPLSIREWSCSHCCMHHDRDVNAALNILNKGLRTNTESSSGIQACGDTSNGDNQQVVSYVPKKQELMSGILFHKL
jgi:putative transposase